MSFSIHCILWSCFHRNCFGNQWKNFALIIIWIRNIFDFLFIFIRWNLTFLFLYSRVCMCVCADVDRASTHKFQIRSTVQWSSWGNGFLCPIFFHSNRNACLLLISPSLSQCEWLVEFFAVIIIIIAIVVFVVAIVFLLLFLTFVLAYWTLLIIILLFRYRATKMRETWP